MKTKHARVTTCASKSPGILAALITFLLASSLNLIGSATLSAQTPTKIWTDTTGDNSWFTGNNWTPTGSPGNADIVAVNNGTTAQIGAADAVAGSLFIGNSLPGSPALAGSTLQLLPGGVLFPPSSVTIGPQGTLRYSGGSTNFTSFLNNGLIQIDTLPYQFPGSITGSGRLTIAINVLLTGPNNTYSGETLITAGTLQAGSTTGLSPNSAFVVNSTLDLNGFSNTIGSLSGNGTVLNNVTGTATLTVGQDNTNTLFSGALQNGAGVLVLTKIGTGTLTLTGANTYSGGTNFNGGTLAVGSDGNLGTGPLSFNGGTLEALAAGGGIVSSKPITLNSVGGTFLADAGTASTLSGPITGAGSWTMTGQGTLTLTGPNSYSGGTNFNGGTLAVGSDGNLGTGPLSFNGGTLAAGGGLVSSKAITLNSLGGTFLADAGTASKLSGVITGTGSWTKAGPGTLTLSGANTYTGATTVTAGVLQAGSAVAFSAGSAFTVDPGAVLDLNGFSNLVGSLSGSGLVTNRAGVGGLSNATLSVGADNTSTTFSGVLQDGMSTLALTKVGTGALTLSGANTYSGNTNVNMGTLLVDGSLGTGLVNVASGATLGGTGTIGGPVTIQNGGILAPGDRPGTLTVGTLTLNSGSILNYQLGIPNVVGSSASDLVNVNGNLTLAGSLNVSNASGFGPGVFRLFNYTGSLINDGLSFNTVPSGFTAADFVVQTVQPGQVNLVVSSSGFATQFWDGTNSVADGLIHGGPGIWDNTTTNWTNANATANASWQNGFAVFEGTAGMVTLGSDIQINGMQFLTDGYMIAASGSQTLIGAAATTIRVDQGVSATISAPIVDGSNPAALTKTDLGTLILTGTNTYTGGTTISAGTLQLGNGGTSGSIMGNVADNGTLAFNRSDIITFGGVISGAGNLVNIGTGTVVLTATNTYTGGTTISAGMLQIGTGGTSGSIAGDVIDNGTLAFDRSDSVTFGGVISGTGGLVKLGAGTLTLPSANTYTGATTVNSGGLIVNGSIASAQTVVSSGAFLGGHGTIGGNLLNNGTVGQINSPGTLTVAGNYTQGADGVLQIGVGGLAASQHDTLASNGHVTLGGTLQFVSLGGFTLQPGEQITFIIAKNGVSGSFSNVQNNIVPTGTIVQAQVTSLANSVVLETTQGSFATTPGVATTPNQSAVAKALDSAAGNPKAAALFAFLNSQPLSALPNDLNLIAPTEISSANSTAVSVAKVQIFNVGQRMANIQGGSTGFSAAGFSLNGSVPNASDGFAGPTGPEGKSGPAVFAPTPENRWGVFVTGLGEFTNVSSTPNAAGYDLKTGGFTMGIDYRLLPNFAIGLSGGYAHTGVGLDGGGNIGVNGGLVGLYSTIFGYGLYLDTAINGGPSGYTTSRTALQGTANGNTNGWDFNFLVATGYNWTHGNLTIGPTASFQYGYIGLIGFTETGSLAPLRFASQNTESERTAFGGQATYEWKIGHASVIPQVNLAWQHEFGSTAYSVVANFANGAGNSFAVTGPQIGPDSVLVGAGASVIWNDRLSFYLFYDGEYARTNYYSNDVTGGVRITF